MIAEIGHFSLILALLVAMVQAVLPMRGAARGNTRWMALGDHAALVQCALIGLAFLALTWCYVTSDFSVLNVAENSHSDKPLLYKISGVWGNHEGSMLLWVFTLSLYGAAVALWGGHLPPALRARALAVQAMVGIGFLLFILFTSNPFWRADPAPFNGNGLNPMLQDPGLAFHPPFLYLGYVGSSMAFSFAMAALLEGRVDAAWARWVRPWTLAAWSFLTIGIAMGAWWAYYTLGWGGWWSWDPVENASFMPWLAGAALIHSTIVVEKRDALKGWTMLLTILTFSLSLLGTFLVRSGILTSVHSFASDPARGVFVLALLALVTGGALLLYALRAPALKGGGLFAPISREGALLLNTVLLATAAAAVLLGTLYPLIAGALHLGKLSVGAPFFNALFLPLMMPVALLMAIGSMLPWKRGDLAGAMQRLKLAAVLALLVLAGVWLAQGGAVSMLATAFWMGLAAWLFFGTLQEFAGRIHLFRAPWRECWARARNLPRAAYGMTIAHAALAIVILGITGTSSGSTEKIQVMRVGDRVAIADYTVTLTAVEAGVRGPNYTATQARFTLSRDEEILAEMQPEKRLYTMPPRPTTHAAIRTNLLSDVHVVLGEPDGSGGYVTTLYHKPLTAFIFIGALLIAAGGLVALTDRRLRIGAPTHSRRRT